MSFNQSLDQQIKAMAGIPLEQKYSPDQERDERGRFAGGDSEAEESAASRVKKLVTGNVSEKDAFKKLADSEGWSIEKSIRVAVYLGQNKYGKKS